MLYLKKAFCLLLCLACVTLAACTPAGTNSANRTVTENDIYKIYVEDGQWYMDVKEEKIHTGVGYDPLRNMIIFKSPAEMKSDLLTGQFTEIERNQIKNMGSGKMVDLDTLFSLVYPEDLKGYEVAWYGGWYEFNIKNKASQVICRVVPLSQEEAASRQKRYENWIEAYLVGKFSYDYEDIRVETEPERNATIYYYTTRFMGYEVKDCIYKIEDGDRIIVVFESYYLNGNGDASLPTHFECCYIDDDQCFFLTSPGGYEMPSVEWLTAFDLVPYVEE